MMSWHCAEQKENDILISAKINDDSHATVCTVYGSTNPMNDQYVGASRLTTNVNLICAAPDLLEALQAIVRWQKTIIGESYCPIDAAKEAIAKALASNN